MPRRNWWLVVVLLVLVIGVAGVYFFKGGIGKETGWRTFKNVQSGYEIKLPSGWTNEAVEGAAEVFWSPDRRAYVAVQFIADPRLLKEGGEEKMIREIRESFRKDKGYELIAFRSRFEEEPEPATVSGYLAQGKLSFQKQRYVFQEYAVVVANEEILAVIRGAMQEEVVGEYENIVEEIMGSFDPVVGRREVIASVKKQSEVVDFEKQLAKVGKKAKFAVEDDGSDWLVQVYEVVERGPAEIRGISASLRDGEGHTATFNWYRVNKETNKVTKEFEAD